jgi:hypothetical protein
VPVGLDRVDGRISAFDQPLQGESVLQDQAGTGRALMAQAVLVGQRDQLSIAYDRREPAVGEGNTRAVAFGVRVTDSVLPRASSASVMIRMATAARSAVAWLSWNSSWLDALMLFTRSDHFITWRCTLRKDANPVTACTMYAGDFGHRRRCPYGISAPARRYLTVI